MFLFSYKYQIDDMTSGDFFTQGYSHMWDSSENIFDLSFIKLVVVMDKQKNKCTISNSKMIKTISLQSFSSPFQESNPAHRQRSHLHKVPKSSQVDHLCKTLG